MCEGVVEFKNNVSFKGGVSGISYNSLTNKPDVYTKEETYSKTEVDGVISSVKRARRNYKIVFLHSRSSVKNFYLPSN